MGRYGNIFPYVAIYSKGPSPMLVPLMDIALPLVAINGCRCVPTDACKPFLWRLSLVNAYGFVALSECFKSTAAKL